MYNKFYIEPETQKVHPDAYYSYTLIECTIKGFVDDTVSGQKFTSKVEWTWGTSKLIIMSDLQNLVPFLYKNSYFPRSDLHPQGWKDYILNTP